MCDFKPGDRVTPVCGAPADFTGRVKHGDVLTVDCVWLGRAGKAFLDFIEIPSVRPIGGYDPRLFRKVQRRSSETGMAILKSICDNPGQLEEDTKQDQVKEAARMVFGPWGDYTDDGTFGLR